MFRIIGETNINFIGQRRKAFLISGLLMILGLFAFVMVLLDKANMGIDFVGGTMLQGSFEQPISISDLRTAVTTSGFPEAYIQELDRGSDKHAYIIRVKEVVSGDEKAITRLAQIIDDAFPGNKFTEDSEHVIGPAVGQSLRQSALYAILISIAGMIIYIGIRFDFRSGVAATIATFHDVLAVLGIFFLLNKEITLLVVTALLTLAGYSLTDTVVVFDRIRENIKKFRKKGEFVHTVNRSINEVLSRTIMTSGTTLIVALSLYLFGGEILSDFALALVLGVIVGTYSSVFVASPIVVEWEDKSPRRFK